MLIVPSHSKNQLYFSLGKKIVRGSITQEDPKFGKQPSELSGTTAVIALTMTLLHKTETWSKSIINDIIELGNELYEESKASLRGEFDPWEDKIDLETIKKDFNIGLLKMNFELRLTTQSGIMDSKRPAVPNLRKCRYICSYCAYSPQFTGLKNVKLI